MRRDISDTIKKSFPEILEKHMGIVAYACKEANIARQTYYRWREEDPEFAKLCDDVSEVVGDHVEAKLLKKIKDEDTTGIIFYCKTKLRNRGYTERQELTGPNSGNIQNNIYLTEVKSRNEEIINKIAPGNIIDESTK